MRVLTSGKASRRAVLLLVPAGLATGCATRVDPRQPAASAQAKLLDPSAFAEAIRDPAVTTVNVHTPYEGELPGMDLFVAFDRLRDERSRLPGDPTAPIAVSCRSGRMSSDAVRTLTALGYTDVADLEGGMDAWEANGRTVEHRRLPGSRTAR